MRLIIFLTAVILPWMLAAQQSQRFEHLSLNEGLSQSTIKCLLQDRHGYIWIGTEDGLNRYDGYTFTIFKNDPADSTSLSHNEVRALHESVIDGKSRLWVATFGGGLCLLDNSVGSENRFRRFRHQPDNPNSLSVDKIWSLAENRAGDIWVGTFRGGLVRISDPDSAQPQFRRYQHMPQQRQSLPHNIVTAIHVDHQDDLWIGTPRGLSRLTPDNFASSNFQNYRNFPETPEILRKNTIFSIISDRKNALWIGAVGGLFRMDPTAPKDRQFIFFENDPADPASLSYRVITSIFQDGDGTIWAGTPVGLKKLRQPFERFRSARDWQSARFDRLENDPYDPQSLSENHVLAIAEDQSGVLWFGTTRGINKLSKSVNKFQAYRHYPSRPGSLSPASVMAVYKDPLGNLWVGSEGGGLSLMTPESRSREAFLPLQHHPENPRSLSSNQVYSLLSSADPATGITTLWVGTLDGLNRLDYRQTTLDSAFADRSFSGVARSLRFRHYKHNGNDPGSLSNNLVNALYRDRAGNIWVGTGNGGGLNRLNVDSGRFMRFRPDPDNPNSLVNGDVQCMLEDHLDRLWIGTQGGLSRLTFKADGTAKFRNFHQRSDTKEGLINDKIYSLYQDHRKRIWIGTAAGLSMYAGDSADTFRNFTGADGLPNEVIYSILEDAEGRLWLSTNKGLSKFDTDAAIFRNYDVSDGLLSNEFNAGAAWRSKSGEMFFGGIRGVSYFFPDKVADNLNRPPIVISDFRIFDKSVGRRSIFGAEPIRLSYKENFFSFEFAALDYNAPAKNRYAYKLEGFDQNWIFSGGRRYASYTNLDGGRYTFRVRGANNDGVWNNDGATVDIIIVPPPWKTWWAYCIYALLLMAAILSYIRYKTRAQQKEINRQQTVVEGLQRVDRLKDEFLANTSHELRTPLNGIIGLADSMIEGATGPLSDTQELNLSMISQSGKRLAFLVDDILDFSKLKNNDIELNCKPADLYQMTEIVITLTKMLIGGKTVILENHIPEAIPKVYGDENRLHQILYNLIGNAIKFTDNGEIIVGAAEKGGFLEVFIRDSGIGIPAHKLEDIFKSFEQVDASTSRAYGGTGLGLSITRQLVELHGGSISVESTQGEGSCFRFTIPLFTGTESNETPGQELSGDPIEVEAADALPIPEYAAGSRSIAGEGLLPLPDEALQTISGGSDNSQYKILIVDDEPVNLQVLNNYLSIEDYAVVQSNNGLEALDVIDQGMLPDLIILDVMMPKMSGYDVCRNLREHHSLTDLPIIMLTAKSQTEDMLTGLDVGANDYLAKPFDKRELLARVQTLLTLKKTIAAHDNLLMLQNELDIARKIQQSILPDQIPELPGLDIQVRYTPMEAVGGDFYDFHVLENDDGFGVLVADVSGHGVGAALIGAMVKILFTIQDYRSHLPSELLEHMNNALEGNCGDQFVTASYTFFSLKDRKIVHGDAGHLPLLILKKSTGELQSYKPEGMFLGGLSDIECPSVELPLEVGDRVIQYSDGIIEGKNAAGEMFEKTFLEMVVANADLPADAFSDLVLTELTAWSLDNGYNGYEDDVMLVVVDVT